MAFMLLLDTIIVCCLGFTIVAVNNICSKWRTITYSRKYCVSSQKAW